MDLNETVVPRSRKMEPLKTAADAVCFNAPLYSRLPNEYEDSSQPPLENEVSSQLPRRKDSALYYDMSGDKILIIFNHFKYKKTRYHRKSVPEKRDGTYEDVRSLEDTFRNLGFMVITHDDWKYEDIMNYLTDVCKKDHSKTSCIAVAVMTHGKGSRLSAADRKYPVADITDTLRTAPSLAGKPKLFFIQACRTGHTRQKPRNKEGVVITQNADSLLLYSTYEDHYSYRDSDGSWMMQALCKVINANYRSMNLVQMITLVNRTVAKINSDYGKQMPVTELNLKKFLKF